MVYLYSSGTNSVALTLREAQIGTSSVYDFLLFKDYTTDGYADPYDPTTYNTLPVAFSQSSADYSPNPNRYNLLEINIEDANLLQGWYTYVVNETLSATTSNVCETGKCWVDQMLSITESNSIYN